MNGFLLWQNAVRSKGLLHPSLAPVSALSQNLRFPSPEVPHAFLFLHTIQLGRADVAHATWDGLPKENLLVLHPAIFYYAVSIKLIFFNSIDFPTSFHPDCSNSTVGYTQTISSKPQLHTKPFFKKVNFVQKRREDKGLGKVLRACFQE